MFVSQFSQVTVMTVNDAITSLRQSASLKGAFNDFIFIFRNPEYKHNLFSAYHRSRVDKEDPAGALHPLRLTHDLELNDQRNLRASPRPRGLPALTQGPIFVRHHCLSFGFFFFIQCILFIFFITFYWHLKKANKRL